MSAPVTRRRPQGGPPPLAPALAYGALLIAGVAVPSLILRLTPRPLAWGGLVIAAIGMLSTLTLLTSALDVTLPIARFGGLIFIVAVSALLPATRHRLTAAVPVAA